jgi:hypothetical protein
MIATCYRLKLLDFFSVSMDLPIEPNKKKGKPKLSAPALMRQQGGIVEEQGIEDDNTEAQPQPVVQPDDQEQHGETGSICATCQSEMVKRRY